MDKERLFELIDILNDASDCYYNKDCEKMSNAEYDRLYDELLELEKKLGIIRSDSPSINVGHSISKKLEKFVFDTPMLSLDKTKDIDTLVEFLKEGVGILSYKMDGLTVVMTYENGELVSAVTRGNGKIGEVITQNAVHFKNFPKKIPYKEKLILRGEAVISYADFDKVNADMNIEDFKYKNPRNLCSGTVRALDSSVVSDRGVHFFVFNVVEGFSSLNYYSEKLEKVREMGFEIISYKKVDENNVAKIEDEFSKNILKYPYPVDGLVLIYDDIEFGQKLGTTSKFPRNAIAFKWSDTAEDTILRDIYWNASRTGRINPIAVFDPVEIEGTTVSRASVHNLSTVKSLKLGVGDRIRVYKANMIIPQILENLTESDSCEFPTICPVCNESLIIDENKGVQVLYCPNKNCTAKNIKSFELFVSRDAFNIEGLSTAKLELLISNGFVREFADIFKLNRYKEEISGIEGMGEKSVSNLLEAIERSRDIELSSFIYSLGIKGIGVANANILSEFYRTIDALIMATKDELISINNIGQVMADDIIEYFSDKHNINIIYNLINEIDIRPVRSLSENKNISGKTFVITGSLNHFVNRKALQVSIENMGGKVAGSISKNTDFLITNEDKGSSKSQKAKELKISVITEDDIIKMLEDI